MNCSAWARRTGLRRWLLPLLLAVISSATAGSTAEFDDLVARLQFSFYTGDSRALEQMLSELERFDVDAGLAAAKSYQLAYGQWKLAQLLGEPQDERARATTRSNAGKAAKSCVQFARDAIAKEPRMAEIYAIEAACDTYQPGSSQRGSASCMRSKSMRTALTLGADNPRVLFINALCSPDAEGDPAALERWRTVVTRFEAAPPSRPGKPDWGHAEALTLLGESYLKRGEMVAARDVLERALVLAPDYRRAQKLLQTAANRPR
ncbi:MAG TPA: tetratricopeptide repeat protein [Steroidobacter sp.]|nr:tetratricopeptide repeat protein [Steroidobacter sp.]